MVKSKSNKMHLEINTDMELDVNNASISRRNRKSKKSSSSRIKREKEVSKNLKTRKRMSAAYPKVLSKKKRPPKSISAKRASALKSKKLMPSILNNGKRVSLKAMKMSSAPKMKAVSLFPASGKSASGSRRGSSNSRRKASVSRRKSSVSRRKASRRGASNAKRKASDNRRKAALTRLRDARDRFAKKGIKGAEQSQTIFMPIQQASNGKTAEAIVVSNERKQRRLVSRTSKLLRNDSIALATNNVEYCM